MALTEYQDLLEDMKKLLKQIEANPPNTYPFVVCLPGSNKGFFNCK